MAYNGVPTESDKDLQSLEGAVLSVSLKGTPPPDPNRKRSQSLVIKAGKNVLMPDVGTASEVAMAAGDMGRDDMYIEGISLRRGFASEFVAMLEVTVFGLPRTHGTGHVFMVQGILCSKKGRLDILREYDIFGSRYAEAK